VTVSIMRACSKFLRPRITLTLGGVLTAASLVSGPAAAQATPPDDATQETSPERLGGDNRAAAEALFEEGLVLAEKGQLEAACAKFEASESLDVAVGTLLHLANCYESIGRLATAWARFREARSLAAAQSMPDRERIAAMRAEALEPKLARMAISVPAQVPRGFSVRLGETVVPRASWGSAIPLDAGLVTVEASAPGHESFRKQVSVPVEPGARVTVEVPPLRALRVSPTRPASAVVNDDRGDGMRTIGLTVGVVGALGLASSGALTIVATKRNDESLKHCPMSVNRCSSDGIELRNEAGRLADLATVSAAVGAGLVITGVVLYIASPRSRKEGVSVAVGPTFHARGAGLQAGGAF
jgi:hypothetical protein